MMIFIPTQQNVGSKSVGVVVAIASVCFRIQQRFRLFVSIVVSVIDYDRHRFRRVITGKVRQPRSSSATASPKEPESIVSLMRMLSTTFPIQTDDQDEDDQDEKDAGESREQNQARFWVPTV